MPQIAATVRRIGMIIAGVTVVVVMVSLWIASTPFSVRIPLADFVPNAEGSIVADCRPPIVSAWQRGDKDELRTWIIEVRTNMVPTGGDVRVTPTGGEPDAWHEPWCGEHARPRLLLAIALLVAAATPVIWFRRRVARWTDAESPIRG